MSDPDKSVAFGQISECVLIGGGAYLCHVASIIRQFNIPFLVVTSPRQMTEIIDLKSHATFGEWLEKTHCKYHLFSRYEDLLTLPQWDKNGVLGFSISAPWIFKNDLIEKLKPRLLNLHLQRLPLNRGAGGYSWMIMSGDTRGGAVIHLIDAGVDTGQVISRVDYTFPETCRIPIDYSDYSRSFVYELIDHTFNKILKNQSIQIDQSDKVVQPASTYFPRLNTLKNGWIDWQWSGNEIEKFVCAFDDPYPGASTYLADKRVHIKAVRFSDLEGPFHPFQAGLVYRRLKGGLLHVATKNGLLAIKQVLDEKQIPINELVKVGDRFYTPRQTLDQACSSRVLVTPDGFI